MFKDYDNYVKKECSKIPPSLMFNGYSQINTIHGADKNLEKINQISQVSTSTGTVAKEQDLTNIIAKKIVDPVKYEIAKLRNDANQKIVEVQKVERGDFDYTRLTLAKNAADIANYKANRLDIKDSFRSRSKADLQTLIKDLKIKLLQLKDKTTDEDNRREFVRKSMTSLTQPNKEQIIEMYLNAYELIDPYLTDLYKRKNADLSTLLFEKQDKDEDEGEGEEGEGEEGQGEEEGEDVPELEEVEEGEGQISFAEALFSKLTDKELAALKSGDIMPGYEGISAPSVASKDSAPSFMNEPVDFTSMMFRDDN